MILPSSEPQPTTYAQLRLFREHEESPIEWRSGPEPKFIRKVRCPNCRRYLSPEHYDLVRGVSTHNPSPDTKKYRSVCQDCRKKDQEEQYRRQKHQRIAYKLQKHYGLSYEDYTRFTELQQGVCAICRDPETWTTQWGTPASLSVDHDHKAGRVRGLLCNRCNRGLGAARDDPVLLERMAEYLELFQQIA